MSKSIAQNLIELTPNETEVGLIMMKNLTTAPSNQPLEQLITLFEHITFHHVPVTNDGKLVGILSDRDISQCIASSEDKSTVTAADIMSPEPIIVAPSTTVEIASILLLENKISCLPVVSEQDELVGILTWKDLLRFFVYHP